MKLHNFFYLFDNQNETTQNDTQSLVDLDSVIFWIPPPRPSFKRIGWILIWVDFDRDVWSLDKICKSCDT